MIILLVISQLMEYTWSLECLKYYQSMYSKEWLFISCKNIKFQESFWRCKSISWVYFFFSSMSCFLDLLKNVEEMRWSSIILLNCFAVYYTLSIWIQRFCCLKDLWIIQFAVLYRNCALVCRCWLQVYCVCSKRV